MILLTTTTTFFFFFFFFFITTLTTLSTTASAQAYTGGNGNGNSNGGGGRGSTSLGQQKNSFEGADRTRDSAAQRALDRSLNKSEIVLLVLMSTQNELPVLFDVLKPAVELATEYVNSRYSAFSIRVVARKDAASCEANSVAGMAAEEYYLRQVNGIIGPICTRALDPVARLAAHWGVPVITAGGIGIEFANKNVFRSLTRIAFSLGEFNKI